MREHPIHPEALADAHADRRAWGLIVILTVASWFVLASSESDELVRAGSAPGLEPWLREAASHLASLLGFLLIPFMISRFPVSSQNWMRTLPTHFVASIVFSLIHTVSMVTIRKLTYPVLLDMDYTFGLTDPSVWLYEYRKDAYAYLLVACVFASSRALEQRVLEARAAQTEARQKGRLTLKSGGRTIMVDADDVLLATAASNYVEITTQTRTHLARITLSALETLLSEAGASHIRVHRSHIVHKDHISEIIPSGDGNVIIRLDNDITITGSRSYRDRLPKAQM